MKLKSISLRNFRTYKNLDISLEKKPKIILIHGNNGYGKTSLFDSIEWGITGKIKRYENDFFERKETNFIKNCFSKSNENAKVKLEFTEGVTIERESEGSGKEDYKNSLLKGITEEEIIEKFFGERLLSKDKVNDSFNFVYLLSQDLISDFMRRTKEQDRYDLLSKIYGFSSEIKYQDYFKGKEKELKEEIKDLDTEINSLLTKKNEYFDFNLDVKATMIELDEIFYSLNKKKSDVTEKMLLEMKEESSAVLKNINFELNKLEKKLTILSRKEKYEEEINQLNTLKKRKEILEKNIISLEKYEEVLRIEKNLESKKIFLQNQNQKYKKINTKKIKRILRSHYDNLIITDNLNVFLIENKSFFSNDYEERKNIINKTEEKKGLIKEYTELLKNSEEVFSKFVYYSKEILRRDEEGCPLCGNSEITKSDIKVRLKDELEVKSKLYSESIYNKISSNEKKVKVLEEKLKEKDKNLKSKILSTKKMLEEELEKRNEIEALEKNIEEYYLRNRLTSEKELIEFKAMYLKKINTKFPTKEKLLDQIKLINEDESRLKTQELNEYLGYKLENIVLDEVVKKIKDKSFEKESRNNICTKIERSLYLLSNSKKINFIEKITEEQVLFQRKKKIYNDILKEVKAARLLIKKEMDKNITESIKNYSNAINKFYKYLNPHKKFSSVALEVDIKPSNKSKVSYETDTKEAGKLNPTYLFSSAQSNLLALSTFLGINLATNNLALDTILLDDPIQNMDDINIHSFVDILKQLSYSTCDKQIILSTHDERIADYIKHKLKENVYSIELVSYGEIKS